MTDDPDDGAGLLPYDLWTQDALRLVMARALAFAGRNGLPGEHHFYVTFRTDYPGVEIPPRLLAKYKHEMTIVLQHQFWDLKIDEAAGTVSVGLSFGGIPSTLVIPLAAVTAFNDPPARLALRFVPPEPAAAPKAPPPPAAEAEPAPEAGPQVISLDAFRRRPPTE